MFLLIDNTPSNSITRIITKTPSLRTPGGHLSMNKILKNLLPIGSKLKTKTILTIQE